jgi:2-isopropylmalate synthase
VDFSAEEKRQILASLDDVGVDYIEGGWPGANPTDTDFFKNPPKLFHARLSAFGMTRRAGQSVGNDDLLMRILFPQQKNTHHTFAIHLAKLYHKYTSALLS